MIKKNKTYFEILTTTLLLLVMSSTQYARGITNNKEKLCINAEFFETKLHDIIEKNPALLSKSAIELIETNDANCQEASLLLWLMDWLLGLVGGGLFVLFVFAGGAFISTLLIMRGIDLLLAIIFLRPTVTTFEGLSWMSFFSLFLFLIGAERLYWFAWSFFRELPLYLIKSIVSVHNEDDVITQVFIQNHARSDELLTLWHMLVYMGGNLRVCKEIGRILELGIVEIGKDGKSNLGSDMSKVFSRDRDAGLILKTNPSFEESCETTYKMLVAMEEKKALLIMQLLKNNKESTEYANALVGLKMQTLIQLAGNHENRNPQQQ